jgi:ribonuclease BN (tRNA processing enzyme)
MSVEVLFLGTGDAFGTGGRLHTATLVTTPASTILVDCGPSTLAALRRAGVDPGSIDRVLLTHLHGDHFAGLPFFLMDAHFASRRTRPLTIAGPDGTHKQVETLLDVLFPGNGRLPVTFSLSWPTWKDGTRIEWPDVAVTPMEVSHSRDVACYGLRLECGERIVAFSGDTEWTDRLVDLSTHADLFVCECFGYDTAPPRHLDYRTLMKHRPRLSCRDLVVTHMGPQMLDRIAALDTRGADDGIRLTV